MTPIPPVKAIPTRYAGCHFRSRLEARWAVFFDAMNIVWEYEPEGFTREWQDEQIQWLPDFHLPETNTWIEVKGSDEQLRADWHRLLCMIDWGSPVPGVEESDNTQKGVLLLGPIPRVDDWNVRPMHPIAQHHKGVSVHCWSFFENRGDVLRRLHPWPVDLRPIARDWPTADDRRVGNYFDASWGSEHCFSINDFEDSSLMGTDWRVEGAYKAARGARFEYGQNGAT